MTTINIVGAGLAGSIMAKVLEEKGFECRIIDSEDKHSASRASSNLYIASWLKKFSSEKVREGIATLERLYGAKREQPFAKGVAVAARVWHIPQREILRGDYIKGLVVLTDSSGVYLNEGERLTGPTVVCGGHQAELLAQMPNQEVKVGHCIFLEGELPPGRSTLQLVSPYTHEKLYQYAPGIIYYADSVAVSPEAYKQRETELRARTLVRAERHFPEGLPKVLGINTGYRPFVKNSEFVYAERFSENQYVLTGGGKNGMVAYAYGAERIARMIQDDLR